MNSSCGRTIIACLLMAHGAFAVAQTPMVSGDEGQLIDGAFAAAKIKPPELGWILPNGELVTEVNAKEVSILAHDSAPRTAPQIGTIAANAVPAFVKRNQVDCDQMNEEKPLPIYRYAAKMPASKVAWQVLVLPGRQASKLRLAPKSTSQQQHNSRPSGRK
jgi:hypothetical protein